MTILDSELFQKIEIPEVLIWAQEQNEERSPNLTLFTAHFNKLSYWWADLNFYLTLSDFIAFLGRELKYWSNKMPEIVKNMSWSL